jgi:hypothetical protein
MSDKFIIIIYRSVNPHHLIVFTYNLRDLYRGHICSFPRINFLHTKFVNKSTICFNTKFHKYSCMVNQLLL